MTRHCFTITLTLRGPVLTKSSSPAAFGVDAAVARVAWGPQIGRPCIPGTLIKGKVREALDQLMRARAITDLDLGKWFGNDTQRDSGNEPARGCLHFGDLVAQSNPQESRVRHGIAIEPVLGSVKGEMLRVIEAPFSAGEDVTFAGRIWYYGADPENLRQKLLLGLRWLTQVGAERTTGFGRVINAEVEAEPAESISPTTIPDDIAALDLTIKPLLPLCISKHKIGGNLFESEKFIPGNMLAGALMETAKALRATIEHFDELVFRHAFPAPEGGPRPPVLPLSAVSAGEVLYDAASLRAPHLARDEKGNWQAPAFPPDWKGKTWAEADRRLGLVHPARELRVRTAIDSENRTGDKGEPGIGGALFAWEMIHPWKEHTNGERPVPLVWKGHIDLMAISDPVSRKQVARQLAALLPQLGFVSKTKIACQVTAVAVAPQHPPELKEGESLTLVLRTPAQLCDPRFQDTNDAVATHGALSAAEMLKFYRAAWDELSGDSLCLEYYFARQFLAGGNHLAMRFQFKGNHRQSYAPWLLTEAGSVFVFTVQRAAGAKDKLREWLNNGLPLPRWARGRFGETWQANPYRPQNGFGEVAVHQPTFAIPEAQPINLVESILP